MALSDADKAELRTTMAEGIAEGLALFRSKTEEEQAKLAAANQDKNTGKEGGSGDTSNSDGFSLQGFLLGG